MTTFGSMHIHGAMTVIVRPHNTWMYGGQWRGGDTARSYVEIIIIDGAGNHSVITLFGEPSIQLPDDIFEAELRRRGDEAAQRIHPTDGESSSSSGAQVGAVPSAGWKPIP